MYVQQLTHQTNPFRRYLQSIVPLWLRFELIVHAFKSFQFKDPYSIQNSENPSKLSTESNGKSISISNQTNALYFKLTDTDSLSIIKTNAVFVLYVKGEV